MEATLIANTPEPQRLIETCARISYNSQNYPFDPEVNSKFIRKLIANGHESPMEHASATFLIEGISRACSHQIVRHRLCSFTQMSQRYVEFNSGDPNRSMSFTMPKDMHDMDAMEEEFRTKDDGPHHRARAALVACGHAYDAMIEAGIPKEDARLILPQGIQTSLYMTANMREWRHFLQLRLDKHAQWEIRGVAEKVLGILFGIAPDVFFDLTTITNTTTTGENP